MKKLFFLLIMFVNVQIGFKVAEFNLTMNFGSRVLAQHMFKEAGDNCFMGGEWWYVPAYMECEARDSKEYHCAFCNVGFDTYEEKASHETTCEKKEENNFHCSFCDHGFSTREDWESHEKSCDHNPQRIMYECYTCGAEFPTEKERNNHSERCLPKVTNCSKCHESFVNKYGYKHHRCWGSGTK